MLPVRTNNPLAPAAYNGLSSITELDMPADLIVVDRLSRRVESVLVWGENGTLTDIARIKRLVEREQSGWGSELEVVAVEARTTSLGQVLQDNEIIKLC